MEFIEAYLPEHFEAAQILIEKYLEFLGEDLRFQHMDEEFRKLPLMYGPPSGSLLLCRSDNGVYAGMVGLRSFDKPWKNMPGREQQPGKICEMKRLYVLPGYDGQGIGKNLCLRILEKAASLGYHVMVLDTLRRLESAFHLYKHLGFQERAAYYDNPLPGVVYMEKYL